MYSHPEVLHYEIYIYEYENYNFRMYILGNVQVITLVNEIFLMMLGKEII